MKKDFKDYVIEKDASVRVISITMRNTLKSIGEALLKDRPLRNLGKKSRPELIKLYKDYMLEFHDTVVLGL